MMTAHCFVAVRLPEGRILRPIRPRRLRTPTTNNLVCCRTGTIFSCALSSFLVVHPFIHYCRCRRSSCFCRRRRCRCCCRCRRPGRLLFLLIVVVAAAAAVAIETRVVRPGTFQHARHSFFVCCCSMLAVCRLASVAVVCRFYDQAKILYVFDVNSQTRGTLRADAAFPPSPEQTTTTTADTGVCCFISKRKHDVAFTCN